MVSGGCPPFPLPSRMQYFPQPFSHLLQLQPLLYSLEGPGDSGTTTKALGVLGSWRASLRRARGPADAHRAWLRFLEHPTLAETTMPTVVTCSHLALCFAASSRLWHGLGRVRDVSWSWAQKRVGSTAAEGRRLQRRAPMRCPSAHAWLESSRGRRRAGAWPQGVPSHGGHQTNLASSPVRRRAC